MRNIVSRTDGRRVHVPRMRGHLFVCADGCCCGRTQDGFPPVPRARFHDEWERRSLRTRVHLTIGGCLGPCRLANVVMLLFDGRQAWFHSINSEADARALYDYIEQLLGADAWQPPPPALAPHHFTASTWEPRPDGQPVDDRHLRPRREGCPGPLVVPPAPASGELTPDHLVANMDGAAAVPRKNGELLFEAPWQGRVFGLAVALQDRRLYGWQDFQRRLIAEIAGAEARGEPSAYYERWLRSFERLLVDKGLVTREELDERTEEFEFGERDDVF
jgi:nitrile hydratase accessory protein